MAARGLKPMNCSIDEKRLLATVAFNAGSKSRIAEGRPLPFVVCDRPILLYRIGEVFYATAAKCTHADVDLAEGRVVNGLIECPLHAAYFDIATGRGMGAPITKDLQIFPVSIEGDDVIVHFNPQVAINSTN